MAQATGVVSKIIFIYKDLLQKNREAYIRSSAALASFHDHPVKKLSNDQIQDYLLYISRKNNSPSQAVMSFFVA